nr:retrotransposon protein, putative, Ty1-copia subclass [Tanacetum cinerariifolium]
MNSTKKNNSTKKRGGQKRRGRKVANQFPLKVVVIIDLRFGGCSIDLQAGPKKIRECSCVGNERILVILVMTVTELHALLIDYEKGLKDKAPTPQVFTVQKGRENKPKPQANKKDKSKGKTDKNKKVMPYQPKPKHNPLKGKENLNKDQTCHHCHVAGHWKRNCPLYLEELRKNKDKAEYGAAASELQLGKKIKALRSDRGGEYLSQEFKDYLRYPKETMSYYFYFLHENKVIVAWYGNFLERDLISQKFSGRDNDLEDDHIDTLPSQNNSEIPVESESLGSSPKLILVRSCPMLDPDKLIWQGAMDEEMNFMKVKKVWIVVDLPHNAKVVRSKWLYKKKTDMDGKVHTYKARLVAKGCTQTYEIDYEETFSPIVDIRAIRILIAIAAYFDYEIWQMDVKTACLNGRLDKDIYMEQPEGLKEVKDYLGKCFSMKDFEEAAYILGIKIYKDRSRGLIRLSQSTYIDKMLKKYNIHNSKKGYLPMEVKHDLCNELCASTPEEVAYMKKVPYASAVGSIMCAVRCTRPDVAFAQNLVSRYQQNPGKLHWIAVKHILKYLRNTRDMFLVYGAKPNIELDVIGFCDASCKCDKDDTKTGYVFVINGEAVDWKSKMQTTIAMDSVQAEYVAALEAIMEAVWIRKFVGDIRVIPSINKPINMYCDNSAAIIFTNEPGIMKDARYFLRRYHYVREQVETGEIKLIKVNTDDNLVDPFTKALPRGMVIDHANGIGLQLATSFMHTCD